MTDLEILKWLERTARPIVGKDALVVYPNEPIGEELSRAPLVVEIFATGRAYETETEESTVATSIGSLVLSGETNAGIGRLDKLTDELTRAFRFADGFTDELGGRAYAVKTERSESGAQNGRFKITIFVTLEIQEDK